MSFTIGRKICKNLRIANAVQSLILKYIGNNKGDYFQINPQRGLYRAFAVFEREFNFNPVVEGILT